MSRALRLSATCILGQDVHISCLHALTGFFGDVCSLMHIIQQFLITILHEQCLMIHVHEDIWLNKLHVNFQETSFDGLITTGNIRTFIIQKVSSHSIVFFGANDATLTVYYYATITTRKCSHTKNNQGQHIFNGLKDNINASMTNFPHGQHQVHLPWYIMLQCTNCTKQIKCLSLLQL